MEVKVSAASHQHDLSLRMLTLVTWLWSCLSGFFTARSLFLLPSIPSSVLGSHCAAHPQRVGLVLYFPEGGGPT